MCARWRNGRQRAVPGGAGVTNPHTIIQALDGAAHVWVWGGGIGIPPSVQLDLKEASVPSAEASISLSPDAADALGSMLHDMAARARVVQMENA